MLYKNYDDDFRKNGVNILYLWGEWSRDARLCIFARNKFRQEWIFE